MAAKEKTTQTPALDPEASYRVELTRSVPVGRRLVHPGPNVQLRGDILAALMASAPDAVAAHEPFVVLDKA